MKILLASSEVHPYSKTGGLADMIGALGKALARAGHQVGMVTPLYHGIRERFPDIQPMDWRMDLPLGGRRVGGQLWFRQAAERLTVYFIRHDGYYDRAGIYQENGRDHPDNAERFIFFSKAIAHLGRYLPWRPEVLHVNDWHTGLVPLLVRHQSRAEGWAKPPGVCLTIHNLAYQGVFPAAAYGLTNLPGNYFTPEGAEYYGQLNCLKAGLLLADALTTVSPRYAREITTEVFGHGLDGVLRRRQKQLTGVLNGVDYEEWTTRVNPHLAEPYSANDLAGKAVNKQALQTELGLPPQSDVPLFGTISRLADQKGMDIELGALEEMLAGDVQFVLLGSGAPHLEHAFRRLAGRFPGKACVRIGYDHGLSHRIEAGCDFYLMPSLFEPCGLNQMYSLRYGTIPIVRRTGGLDDTVVDATDNPRHANGIKFTEYSAPALAKAMRKALALYQIPDLMRKYRRNGMLADFSWDRTVRKYAEIYGAIAA